MSRRLQRACAHSAAGMNAAVRRMPQRFVSHTLQKERPLYVHPLSEASLGELAKLAPPWYDPANVAWHPREGTFMCKFALPGVRSNKGVVQTMYDGELRNHFLVVEYGELQGRVSLSDNSKSAWQSNIGDDLARVPSTIQELCTRIEEASRGVLPGAERASPPEKRPASPPTFPFPDNVRPLES